MRLTILPTTLAALTVGLFAVAGASAQQTTCPPGQGTATAYCQLSQNPGKVPPKALSAVTKHMSSSKFRTTGALGLPASVGKAGCTGKIAVHFMHGKKTVKLHRVALKYKSGKCTYSSTDSFTKAKLSKVSKKLPVRLTVVVSFPGNALLKAKKAKTHHVTAH